MFTYSNRQPLSICLCSLLYKNIWIHLISLISKNYFEFIKQPNIQILYYQTTANPTGFIILHYTFLYILQLVLYHLILIFLPIIFY